MKVYFKLLAGVTILIFNYSNRKCDYNYVDDIVEGVVHVMQKAPERDFGFKQATSLRDGLRKFAEWYREFCFGGGK